MKPIVLDWFEHLKAPGNRRESNWARSRRVKKLRQRTRLVYAAIGQPKVPRGAKDVVITFIREAPRALDSQDNLPGAFKPILDEIVDCLGYKDDSDRRSFTLRYEQDNGHGREYRARVIVDWS